FSVLLQLAGGIGPAALPALCHAVSLLEARAYRWTGRARQPMDGGNERAFSGQHTGPVRAEGTAGHAAATRASDGGGQPLLRAPSGFAAQPGIAACLVRSGGGAGRPGGGSGGGTAGIGRATAARHGAATGACGRGNIPARIGDFAGQPST